MNLRYRTLLLSLSKYLPETKAIIDRAVSEGFTLPSTPTLEYINTLIYSMKADGYWSKRDLILNFAYNDLNCQDFSRINWKNPTGALMTRTGFTNLIPMSEVFTSGWGGVSGGVGIADVTTAPDSTMTGSKYYGTTNTSRIQRGMSNFLRVSIDTQITFSMYAKADVLDELRIGGAGTMQTVMNYNLTTGVVSLISGSVISSGMTNVGNGWWRCWLSADWLTTNFFNIHTNPRFQGTDDGIFIWGAQLNEGTTPLPYVKTTTNADTGDIIYNKAGWVGYQTQNSNTFLNTNFNLVTDSIQYTDTDASREVIVQESGFSNSILDGNSTGVGESMRNGNTSAQRIVSNTTNLNSAVNLGGVGYRAINRTSSTNVELFVGDVQNSRTQSNADGITNGNQIIHSGQGGFGGSANISYYSIGAEVVSEGQLLRAAYNTYLNNIGLTPIA